MTMTNPDDMIMIQQWIDGFVDDTSLFSNLRGTGHNTNDIELLHQKLSQDLIAWKDLLEALGGKLELSKCFYYILSWKFNELGDAIPTSIEEQQTACQQIAILDGTTNREIKIHQKEINEYHSTLGCKKTMTGCNKGQQITLKQKSDNIGIKVKNCGFNRRQGWMALNGCYMSSLKYSLPAMSFTRKEIDEIQKFTIDKFLSVIGYDHSTHRSIVFGPKEFGGLGIRHLFTEMMEMKINAVMSHIRANSRLGQAFRINIDYLQLTSGQTKPIFESNFLPTGCSTYVTT
jgi:DNA mismatch repair ATPase MutS